MNEITSFFAYYDPDSDLVYLPCNDNDTMDSYTNTFVNSLDSTNESVSRESASSISFVSDISLSENISSEETYATLQPLNLEQLDFGTASFQDETTFHFTDAAIVPDIVKSQEDEPNFVDLRESEEDILAEFLILEKIPAAPKNHGRARDKTKSPDKISKGEIKKKSRINKSRARTCKTHEPHSKSYSNFWAICGETHFNKDMEECDGLVTIQRRISLSEDGSVKMPPYYECNKCKLFKPKFLNGFV